MSHHGYEWRFYGGSDFITLHDLMTDPDVQRRMLGVDRRSVEYLAQRYCPQELSNFREHWQLQLDLNQPAATRLEHRAKALECVGAILTASTRRSPYTE